MIQRAREAPRVPSPGWERVTRVSEQGEGRTVQDGALRLTLLTTGCASLEEGLPSPQPSPTREREFRRVSPLPGSSFETACGLLRMRPSRRFAPQDDVFETPLRTSSG
jgi:hypothetical protein